jgi:hypothetical protein
VIAGKGPTNLLLSSLTIDRSERKLMASGMLPPSMFVLRSRESRALRFSRRFDIVPVSSLEDKSSVLKCLRSHSSSGIEPAMKLSDNLRTSRNFAFETPDGIVELRMFEFKTNSVKDSILKSSGGMGPDKLFLARLRLSTASR